MSKKVSLGIKLFVVLLVAVGSFLVWTGEVGAQQIVLTQEDWNDAIKDMELKEGLCNIKENVDSSEAGAQCSGTGSVSCIRNYERYVEFACRSGYACAKDASGILQGCAPLGNGETTAPIQSAAGITICGGSGEFKYQKYKYTANCKTGTQCIEDGNGNSCMTQSEVYVASMSSFKIGADNGCIFGVDDALTCPIDCKKEAKNYNNENYGCKSGFTCAYSDQPWYGIGSYDDFVGCAPFGVNQSYKKASGYSNNYCESNDFVAGKRLGFSYGDYYYEAACSNSSYCAKIEGTSMGCVVQADACGGGKGLQKNKNPSGVPNFQFCLDANRCEVYKEKVLDSSGEEMDSFVFYYFRDINNINASPLVINCPTSNFDVKTCQYNRVPVETAIPDANKDNSYPVFDGCDSGGVSGWLEGAFTNTIGRLITFILSTVLDIFSSVMGLILSAILAGLDWVLGMQSIKSNTVNIIWLYMRDIANLGFVAALLYIAFATVLRIQTANMRRLLPKFVLAVVLVNFSKLIAFTVSDIAQFFINNFAQMVIGKNDSFNIMSTIGHIAGAEVWGGGDIVGDSLIDFATVAGSLLFGFIVEFLLVIAFGMVTLMLILRIIVIWLLVAISPLIYLAMAFGQKQWVDKWWKSFLAAVFFGPVMLFCLVVAVIILSKPVSNLITSSSNVMEHTADFNEAMSSGAANMQFDKFMQMLFALGFVMAGLQAAKKSSMMGASGVVGMGNKAIAKGKNLGMKWGVKKPGLATGKFAKRQTLDRAETRVAGTKLGKGIDKMSGYRLSERQAKKQSALVDDMKKIKDPRRLRAIVENRLETGLKGDQGRKNKLAALEAMAQNGQLRDEDKKYIQAYGGVSGASQAMTEMAKAKPDWLQDTKNPQTANLRSNAEDQIRLTAPNYDKDVAAQPGDQQEEYRMMRQLSWALGKFKPADAGNMSNLSIDRMLYDSSTAIDENGQESKTKTLNSKRAQIFLSQMSPAHLANIGNNNPSAVHMIDRAIKELHEKLGGISNIQGFRYDEDGNFGLGTSSNGAAIEKFVSGVNAQGYGYSTLVDPNPQTASK